MIHAERAARRRGEERRGRALAHPVVGDGVEAVEHFLVGGVEHLEGGHDLARRHRIDLEAALRQLVDALGEDPEVVLQRVARRPRRLHLERAWLRRLRAGRNGEHGCENSGGDGGLAHGGSPGWPANAAKLNRLVYGCQC
jgi:hypothetical protein